MLPSPSEKLAETLYSKAIAAGLTKVTIETDTVNRINFRKVGRTSWIGSRVICKCTVEQENEFKVSLMGAESENLNGASIRQTESRAGDCPPIRVFATATGEEKTYAWAQDDPKVYLLDFWATWCSPCQKSMAHNQEMLARNDWQDNVEVIAISLDDDKATAHKRIQEKGWIAMGNYWGGEGGFTSDISKLFRIASIPTCLLVKKGKVLWRGLPSDRDCEADINHLIAHDDLPAAVEKDKAAGSRFMQGEELEQLLQQVDNIFAHFLAANPTQTSPSFFYTTKVQKTAESVKISARAISGGSFHLKYKDAARSVCEQVKQIFPALELFWSYSDPIPEIARGDKCVLCDKALSEADIQYLCPYCEPKHYHCQECEDLPREGAGSAKLAHPHKLYKITPLSSHFDELWFGSDIPQDEIKTEDPVDRVHQCWCDNRNSPGGCDGKMEGVHYKCAHCAGIDFCEACEKLYWDTASEEMKATLKEMGHFEHHVLLKIPFP